MEQLVAELAFSSAEAFLSALTPWSSERPLQGYIFRGHSKDRYKLRPTSIRPEGKQHFWDVCGKGAPPETQSDWEYFQTAAEYNLLREFYKLADLRGLYVPQADRVRKRLSSAFDFAPTVRTSAEPWVPDDLLEIAGLAQHYGLPTRLLDWSYDPLISAYFAAASTVVEDWMSVWALDTNAVTFMGATENQLPLRLVTPPYFGNPNLAAQMGLFTSWTISVPPFLSDNGHAPVLIDRRPLDELLTEYVRDHQPELKRSLLVRFKLSGSHSHDVLSLLGAAGYNAAKLFPGYKGVADEILRRHTGSAGK